MLYFTLRRLSLFFFTMLLLTILSFSLCYLFPGDPLINISGQNTATESHLALIGHQYAFEHSVFSQYLAYLQHIFNGDFGLSMTTQQPIAEEINLLLAATVELSLIALLISLLVGIPLGFIAAIFHRRTLDHIILTFSMIGYSVPVFWLGLLSILFFSIKLAWLPSSGNISLLFEIDKVTGFLLIDVLLSDSVYKWQAFQNALLHVILPACVIALAPATMLVRLARTAMLDILETNYIKAAKAKGLTLSQIIYRHAVRNAVIKLIRHIGLQFANLITIAMITEVIFNWPGIGNWLIQSIYQRDYTAIQSGLLVLSTFIFMVHIITDFIYAALNPLAREPDHGA